MKEKENYFMNLINIFLKEYSKKEIKYMELYLIIQEKYMKENLRMINLMDMEKYIL